MSNYKSIRSSILNVLTENENGFLTIEEITERALGPFPNIAFKRLGIKQVKQNMGHAIELGAENGLIIIAKKHPTLKDVDRRFRIAGYKIAEQSDEDYIKEALKNKLQRVEDYDSSCALFSHRLIEKNLIENKDRKQLN